MKIELKYIIEQINDLLSLEGTGISVSAAVNGENIEGWLFVSKDNEGRTFPFTKVYKSIKELLSCRCQDILSPEDLIDKRNETIELVCNLK